MNFFPKSALGNVAITVLRVGMFLTAGSFGILTSILGFMVVPSSLKRAYPRIGQPPLLLGSTQLRVIVVEVVETN